MDFRFFGFSKYYELHFLGKWGGSRDEFPFFTKIDAVGKLQGEIENGFFGVANVRFLGKWFDFVGMLLVKRG